MGEKPLYVSFNDSCLLFGSEPKSLTKFPTFTKEISMNSLSSYFNLIT